MIVKIVIGLLLSIVYAQAKTILLTGTAGFIGGNLAYAFLERGDTVIGIDNFFTVPHEHDFLYYSMKKYKITKLKDEYPNAFIFYEGDITDKVLLEDIFSRYTIDAVSHLAGLGNVRYSLENPELYIKYIIQGTVSILEAMRKHDVMHLVVASSSSVYGDSDQKILTEEEQDDAQLKSPYAVAKRTVELYGNIYHLLYGVNVTCLRLFTVYGEYARMDMAPFLFMDAIATEKPLRIMGDGLAKRDFTFIQDVVSGFVAAIDKPLGYVVINIGGGTTITIKEFIKAIEEIVGKKATLCYQQSHKADVLSTYADICRANLLLGYKPVYSYRQGLQLVYDWYTTVYQELKEQYG
jgi:UDP-glucuronate 4-epimerase